MGALQIHCCRSAVEFVGGSGAVLAAAVNTGTVARGWCPRVAPTVPEDDVSRGVTTASARQVREEFSMVAQQVLATCPDVVSTLWRVASRLARSTCRAVRVASISSMRAFSNVRTCMQGAVPAARIAMMSPISSSRRPSVRARAG